MKQIIKPLLLVVAFFAANVIVAQDQKTLFKEWGNSDLICLHGCADVYGIYRICLLYTSPSPRDRTRSRMPSSA